MDISHNLTSKFRAICVSLSLYLLAILVISSVKSSQSLVTYRSSPLPLQTTTNRSASMLLQRIFTTSRGGGVRRNDNKISYLGYGRATPLIAALFSSISSSPSPSSSSAATNDETSKQVKEGGKKKMPITVLSGFLGAGKTSFLTNLIKLEESSKFGLVVNDVASVNVDSKMIKKQTMSGSMSKNVFDGIDTLELQNGCICCSLAEDLMASVSQLVSLSAARGADYDHIIVECSGIAEPRKIRELFQEAEDYKSPLLDRIRLDTMITLVDATIFMNLFGSDTSLEKHFFELAFKPGDENGQQMLAEGVGDRKITELILEQVECADLVIINKCDLLKQPSDIELVKKVISSINPSAKVFTCVDGKVDDPLSLMGCSDGKGIASLGILDEHRQLIKSAEKGEACAPGCNDPTHDHSHGSHDHGAKADAACAPGCNDPTHDHSHGSHDHGSTTAEQRFGITSFVYKRRRPFHPIRFSLFLKSIGQLSVKGVAGISSSSNDEQRRVEESRGDTGSLASAKRALLRSKGFVWMGTSSAAAYFVSHAGQYLELMVLGRWWADIDRKEWPQGAEKEIMVSGKLCFLSRF